MRYWTISKKYFLPEKLNRKPIIIDTIEIDNSIMSKIYFRLTDDNIDNTFIYDFDKFKMYKIDDVQYIISSLCGEISKVINIKQANEIEIEYFTQF